jgi:hypothetical protein
MSFTLYQTLDVNIPNRDLTAAQKNKLIKITGTLDDTGKEMIYALIKYHNMNIAKINNENYNQTRIEKSNDMTDISWDLSNIPIHLRQILYKFACLEEKRLEEITERHNTQIKMKIKVTNNNK